MGEVVEVRPTDSSYTRFAPDYHIHHLTQSTWAILCPSLTRSIGRHITTHRQFRAGSSYRVCGEGRLALYVKLPVAVWQWCLIELGEV